MPIVTAAEYTADFAEFLSDYEYQPEMTRVLDALTEEFSQQHINEIVLWKLNRYVALPRCVLDALNAVRGWKPKEHRKASGLLEALLGIHGCDVAISSTFLRFRNPAAFQIIDRHAYRAVYGTDYPLFPASTTERKIDVYFKYLDDVHALCEAISIEFSTADRVLYIFDKKHNGALAKKKSGTTPP